MPWPAMLLLRAALYLSRAAHKPVMQLRCANSAHSGGEALGHHSSGDWCSLEIGAIVIVIVCLPLFQQTWARQPWGRFGDIVRCLPVFGHSSLSLGPGPWLVPGFVGGGSGPWQGFLCLHSFFLSGGLVCWREGAHRWYRQGRQDWLGAWRVGWSLRSWLHAGPELEKPLVGPLGGRWVALPRRGGGSPFLLPGSAGGGSATSPFGSFSICVQAQVVLPLLHSRAYSQGHVACSGQELRGLASEFGDAGI